MSLIVNGKEVETDEKGYLIHVSDWCEDIAKLIAQKENLELNKDHWYTLYFLRNFYQQYHKLPRLRVLATQLAAEKKRHASQSANLLDELEQKHHDSYASEPSTSIYLHHLFPKGVLKQASKLAGLPSPARCL